MKTKKQMVPVTNEPNPTVRFSENYYPAQKNRILQDYERHMAEAENLEDQTDAKKCFLAAMKNLRRQMLLDVEIFFKTPYTSK